MLYRYEYTAKHLRRPARLAASGPPSELLYSHSPHFLESNTAGPVVLTLTKSTPLAMKPTVTKETMKTKNPSQHRCFQDSCLLTQNSQVKSRQPPPAL